MYNKSGDIMCGRYTISKKKDEVIAYIEKHFHIKVKDDLTLPRYNVGPGQEILAILYDGRSYRAGLIAWDYQINFKGTFKQIINARSETVDEKYAFKDAFKDKRCLIPADGFYEWNRTTKRPYYITTKEKDLYFYAGIYDGKIIDGKKHFGALILTTEANDLLKDHHHRMPVILKGQQAKQYLDGSLDIHEIKAMLQPYPSEQMTIYPVSKDVNSVKNEGPDLIKKTTKD